MADVTYVCETIFESRGAGQLERATFGAGGYGGFQSKIGAVEGAFSRLSSQLQGMGRAVMAPFDAVAKKAVDVGVGLGKLGVAGGIGLATYGVTHLNKELESTQISLAAIFGAQGISKNMTQGLAIGADVMRDMRRDAAALPGEFQDLVGIFKTVAIPGFGGGLGVKQLESLSSKLMATGAVTGLPMEQVAREAAMLMEGRSGAHNVLGMRLMGLGGHEAERFNKLAPAARIKEMTAAVDKFAPAIAVFSNSFEGLSTTFLDNAKRFLGVATEPLFGKIKDTLRDINRWFSDNEAYVNSEAQAIGSKAAYWFEVGKEKIQEWWPAIETFARNASAEVASIWKTVEPYLEKYGPMMQDFLKSPDAIKKIETAAEIYMGTKAGGAALGTVADVGLGAIGLVQTLKFLGIGGGGAASTAAGGASLAGGAWAAQGATTMGAMTGGTMAAQGEFAALTGSLGTAGSGLLATAGACAAVTAALAGVAAAAWQGYELYNDISEDDRKTRESRIRTAQDAINSMREMDYANKDYQNQLQAMIAAGDELGVQMLWTAAAAKEAAAALESVASHRTEGNAELGAYWGDVLNNGVLNMVKDSLGGKGGRTDTARHPGGGGGTTVQKVEIVVTSNQDPSRVARMVYGELQNLHRHPKISPHTNNYSAMRG